MKIAHVEIMPIVMPKDDPEWRFALGASPEIRGFIIKVSTDSGLVGLGYTSGASHMGSSLGGIRAAMEEYTELLKGHDPFDAERLFGILDDTLSGNNEAKAAIDIALYDLQAKALDLPVYALLGGKVREEIPVIRLLAIKKPLQMATNALRLVEQGYSYIKIKLEGDPAMDLDRVKEIRKAVGDSIHLTVDANQSYTPKVAIDTLKRMYQYGIESAEQPVRANDWQGLAAVTQAVDCLIEAHESARTVEDIFRLVKDRVIDSINLSIVNVGGLRNAKVAAAVCKLGNVSCRVQGIGSRILSAASMHFVASTLNISYACEVGEFSRFLNDPAEGLEVDHGKLKVPSLPGIGVSLRS